MTRTNLLLVAIALSLLGIVMVYSATASGSGNYYLVRGFVHLGLGLGAFFVTRSLRYPAWRRVAVPMYVAVAAALFLVLVPGVGVVVNGARRWFDLGFFSVQPAEFAKVAAVVLLASAVGRAKPGSGLPVKPLLMVGFLFGLVVLEPDFGTSVVILSGAAGVLWASETRTRDLILGGFGLFVGLVGVMLAEDYRRERFFAFLDPHAQADGAGYQVVQSMVAMKSGNFLGAGVGAGLNGIQVPEVRTDMIFALVGEELGLLGMVAVIGAFAFLCLGALKIALEAPSVMGRCLAAGFASMFAAQTVFNMGAAMGIVPLAGMTLPFVSYGGSSLVTCFAALGILHRVSEDGEIVRQAEPRGEEVRHGSERPESLDRRRRDGGTRHPRALRGG